VTSRRPFKYRYSIDRPNRSRESPDRRFPTHDDYDYDATYRDRDRDDRDHDYPRKRRRPLKNPHGSTIYEETVQNAANSNGKRGRNIVDASLNNQEVTSKYREAFHARPNEYAHEFNDEEYLRPRPRKRRPPQNYEFALANAAASSEAPGDPSESSLKTSEDPPTTQPSPDNNAIELKMLLKIQQEKGSSLSEILQRKNLTLSDLLEGKADVINALKSRIVDTESEEYIEEMSRELSNSLMKFAATATPFTESAQMSIMHESTTSAVVSNTLNPVTETSVSNDISKSHGKISSNNTRTIKKELEDVEKVTQSMHDFLPSKATTAAVISTVITTTSTSSPVAMNSMEYFLNDDGNTESTSDQHSAARFENLDEDEIMEFSDFMDFKKGKSQAAPVLLNLPSEEVVPQQSSSRDIVSTLSIEHILQSTERIKLMKNSRDNRDDVTENGKTAIQDDAVSLDETSVEDAYNAFIGAEYQNDAPIDISEKDRRQSGETKHDLNIGKNGALANPIEKQQIANPDNDRKESYDKNHSTEYHQVNRVTVESIRALENHRDTNGRRYEDIVSEIEPEARAEIFELFASGSAGKRLERLLKSRNMSVEELIALRQRGSSKVHLREMSRLQVSGPKRLQTSKTSNINDRDIISFSSTSKFKDSLQHLKNENNSEREEDKKNQFRQDIVSYLHDPLFDRNLENTSLSRLLDLVERDRNASRKITFQKENQEHTVGSDQHIGLENPHRAIDIVDLLTTFGSLPFAKDVHRQFGTEFDNEKETKPLIDNDDANVLLIGDEDNTVRLNTSNKFHDGYVEEIVREQPNIVKTTYSETISDEEENKTLSRLKPSIITSGVILGVTIIVFLAIFIMCRIRQKQRYIYRNTFSRTVFQSPITAARKLSNSSSLSTVMVNVAATSTTRRPERTEMQETMEEFDSKSDMDNDSLDANDSWETIPDYAK